MQHASDATYRGWLKQKMGVAGGVNAGIDMFMQPSNFEQFEATRPTS